MLFMLLTGSKVKHKDTTQNCDSVEKKPIKVSHLETVLLHSFARDFFSIQSNSQLVKYLFKFIFKAQSLKWYHINQQYKR